MMAMSGAASAHDWYDQSCCSDKDCTPVEKIEYKKDRVIFHTKMFSPITIKTHQWSSIRTKPSMDSNYHVCAFQFAEGGEKGNYVANHIVRCVYIPGGG